MERFSSKDSATVTVIGGGANGLFTALDLALRGVKVVLVERGDIGSGTSGKFHGLLHSGARYAVTDPGSAKECAEENEVISRIAPHAVRDTGGLFLGITEEEVEFSERFLRSLDSLGIKHRVMDRGELLKAEPHANPSTRIAVWVPDKVIHGYDLLASVAFTASLSGATILTQAEVVEIQRGSELKVKILDKLTGETHVIESQIIVNASGPWSFKVTGLAGIGEVPVLPTAGIMAVFDRRLNNMVLNRLRPPSDGDILVPYGEASILGTTATVVDDPDNFSIADEEVNLLLREGVKLVPGLAQAKVSRVYASVRPLIANADSGRQASRDYLILEHEEVPGLISVIGGKFTTARLLGEKVGDLVASKLGVKERSKTRDIRLPGPLDLDPSWVSPDMREMVGKVLARRGSLDEERYITSLYVVLSTIAGRKRWSSGAI
ncbi:FAD dependent oxidoreductase [Metallosphaera sedula]|uniref:FAD dependent oxidoreductase n=2 Tax=Metallosphaera sedula TaxID=43687 RepID=A4YFY6_METS5|nr:FAD-dependent oxidoreductase [Metallosphaera sedula]ABP95338.1 FAD dependent oxidoreductase [Metallosphaera sedula DSM 5348]AIM27324.1 FAD dependent oxidoreductase [Metallosphaera sedula]AKV74205.1 FAD-dependent oxidoreductase [Metallosphaera sedula]AKV76444.1 FAD-dependent oxidoreductase [Metallosphaera sedula]AKV78696.1 FAD-dependent oxidoreductase [Metallosphaera sedula]